jgi:hypothetical protein
MSDRFRVPACQAVTGAELSLPAVLAGAAKHSKLLCRRTGVRLARVRKQQGV